MPSLTVPVQVRFADLDLFGHVNNVAYYELMETARGEFLRSNVKALVGHFVLARSECDYRSEIRLGTRSVDVTISIEKVGTTSFVVLHEIRVGEVLAAVGRTVQVAIDADRRPRPLTEDERALLLAD